MSSSTTTHTTTTLMVLLLLLLTITYLPSSTIAQSNSPISPTIAECGPRILPLALCAPFVQGTSTTPTQLCCDNLDHLNAQEPRCICLLLNNSGLSSTFPINSTLAMQLPLMCSVNFDAASCSGSPLSSMSPTPQVSLGSITNSTTNSTVASTPMATVTPKTPLMGIGFHPNYAMKLQGSLHLHLRMMVVLTILTCMWINMLY